MQSGFPQSSLIIVLETEAAFFYYQFKVANGHMKEKEVRVGKKYLVACLGGNYLHGVIGNYSVCGGGCLKIIKSERKKSKKKKDLNFFYHLSLLLFCTYLYI